MNALIPDGLRDVLVRAKEHRPITRAMVQDFESMIKAHPLAVAPSMFHVKHHFAPGVYMRELHVPTGMITTGKIHKYPCLNILAKGRRVTLVEDHLEMVVAPHIQLSPAGMKRVSYTLEDAIWITVHPTDKTDIEEIERDLVCETEDDYRAFLAGTPCLS